MQTPTDNAADLDRYIDIVSEFSRDLRNERAQLARLEALIEKTKRDRATDKDYRKTKYDAELHRLDVESKLIRKQINSIQSQMSDFQTAIERRERWM